jgi:hypothetical protein
MYQPAPEPTPAYEPQPQPQLPPVAQQPVAYEPWLASPDLTPPPIQPAPTYEPLAQAPANAQQPAAYPDPYREQYQEPYQQPAYVMPAPAVPVEQPVAPFAPPAPTDQWTDASWAAQQGARPVSRAQDTPWYVEADAPQAAASPARRGAGRSNAVAATADQSDLWFLQTDADAVTKPADVAFDGEHETANEPSMLVTSVLTVGMAIAVIGLVLLFIVVLTGLLR